MKKDNYKVIQRLQLIEEMQAYNQKIINNPTQVESIIRSNNTTILLDTAKYLILDSELVLDQDKRAVERVLNYFVNLPKYDVTKIPIQETLNILIQVLRGEHIPSDLRRLSEIQSNLVKDLGQDFSGANGASTPQNSPTKDSVNQSNKRISHNGTHPKLNSSYSAHDMVATINIPGRGPIVIGEIEEISYSILKEKNAVRAMGVNNIKGFTKGGRFITGTLVFAVFNHSVVYSIMKEYKEAGYPILMDELPLFNIEVVMKNEYGSQSRMTIYGVTTVREAMSLGIYDIYIQNAYDFFAIDVDPIEDYSGSKFYTSRSKQLITHKNKAVGRNIFDNLKKTSKPVHKPSPTPIGNPNKVGVGTPYPTPINP